MSVTFAIRGRRIDYEDPTTFLNLNSRNAHDFLVWLGIQVRDGDLYGEMPASELAALCRRRLWPEARNDDPALEGSDTKEPGRPRVIVGGRRPGYLREKTAELLRLCERAGEDGIISWG